MPPLSATKAKLYYPLVAADDAKTLLELAQARFPDLSDAERRLFEAAVTGVIEDYCAPHSEDTDPAQAEKWGESRTLRAECIAWLCTDPKARPLVTHRGIQLRGARLDGDLDLSFARIPFPLRLLKSACPRTINVQNATLPALYLTWTHIGSLTGDGLRVGGDVFLRDGFTATGEVRLVGASIGGMLSCAAGHFNNPNGNALTADRIEVEGSVFLRHEFRATGEVRLLGANIGGNLDCSRAHFNNPNKNALSADGFRVEGDVFLEPEFTATGEVRLLGGNIGGDLACRGGHFNNPNGHALNADRIKVEGGVFLGDELTATGEVRLLGANIGGNLDCSGAHFNNPNKDALSADGLKMEGSVFLRDGFEAMGRVSLVSAMVRQYLICTGVKSPKKVVLDLRTASVATLWDEPESWPAAGNLYLDGLLFERLADGTPKDAENRIPWLRLQPKHPLYPQPYEQLAKVLRNGGYEADARKILIAKEEDRARASKLNPLQRTWHLLFGLTTQYGYNPSRAVQLSLCILLFGWAFFQVGGHEGLLSPPNESAYVSLVGTGPRVVSPNYPAMNSLIYSLDMFLPVVNLYQADYWLPNANRGAIIPGFAWAEVRWGGMLRWYLWFHILSGWVLTTMLVVSLTRPMRA